MENIGLWLVCNAIIDEVKNKASITRKSRLLILKQGPRRRADLLSERKAKSLDENLDEEAARDAEEVLLPFLVRTDSTTLLFIDFSLASPLGPVNSLHVVGVRGEFVRQIFVNGVLLAPSSLDCLLNGRAILLGKSLSRDSITLVRLSVKEPIDSETADCIAAPTEGSKTASFRIVRALASSESLMLKNSGVACSVSRPEGRLLTDNSYIYDAQLTRIAQLKHLIV